jgi:hypothetical protein
VQVVNFNFKPEVAGEDRDSAVDRIKQWDSVVEAAPLKPDARHSGLRRMYHAYVADGADVGETVERLSGLPEVELAEAPAQRHLIG